MKRPSPGLRVAPGGPAGCSDKPMMAHMTEGMSLNILHIIKDFIFYSYRTYSPISIKYALLYIYL